MYSFSVSSKDRFLEYYITNIRVICLRQCDSFYTALSSISLLFANTFDISDLEYCGTFFNDAYLYDTLVFIELILSDHWLLSKVLMFMIKYMSCHAIGKVVSKKQLRVQIRVPTCTQHTQCTNAPKNMKNGDNINFFLTLLYMRYIWRNLPCSGKKKKKKFFTRL